MRLDHLQTFVVAVDRQNFQETARHLGISPLQVSRRISSIEKELSVQLFERTTHPLQLTPSGKIFLAEIRPALDQIKQGIELAQRASQGKIGKLTIGLISTITNSILPDIFYVFREHFPNVDLFCQELSPQIQCLRDGEIDIGFFFLPANLQHYDDLIFETIWQEPLIVALPRNHPLTVHDRIPLTALKGINFILPTTSTTFGLSESIVNLCRQENVQPKIVQEAILVQTILGLVASGMGVALLPANAQNFQHRRVVYRPIQGQTPKVNIGMGWRRNDTSQILQNFLEVVREIAQESRSN